MMKHELLGLPLDADGARRRSAMFSTDAHLRQLFWTLLDDEDLEEVMEEFLIPAGQMASQIPAMARSAERPAARRELSRAAAASSARRALVTSAR